MWTQMHTQLTKYINKEANYTHPFNIHKTKKTTSSPINSRQTEGEKLRAVTDFIFLASKITADDCSHETKGCLLLGRKAMTNLDSILKSRNITLPTKIHIVIAMVSPVVMYGCDSWTIKKAECWRIDAFQLWHLEKTLESPLDSKEIKPVNPKQNQPWIFIERTHAEAEAPILCNLIWRVSLLEKALMLGKIEGKRRREQRIRCSFCGCKSEQTWDIVKDREAWCTGAHEVWKSWIGLRNRTTAYSHGEFPSISLRCLLGIMM